MNWIATLLDLTKLRAELAAHYDLSPSLEAAEATRDIYERMDRVVPLADWAMFAPYVIAINRLKAELTRAFAAPEESYRPLTAAEVIARNRG